MKNKTPLLLGGIFIILVAIFLATSINPPEKSKGATPLFEDVKPSIDKLDITTTRHGQIVLEFQNGIWNITKPFQYRAAETTVDQTIKALQDIVVDGVISNRAEAQDQFEVSDSTGTSLKAYSGDTIILDAIVGKHSTDLGHTYARMSNSNEIVLWRGLFSSQVSRAPDDWRDKSIYSFNEDDIIAVKAVEGTTTRELALADTLWVYSENGKEKPVDQSKVREFIPLIAKMRCDAFADEKDIPRAAGKEPDTRVSFTVRNGDTHVFDVWTPGDDDAGRYLVRTENGEVLFRFYRYRGSQLVIDYEKIKAEEET